MSDFLKIWGFALLAEILTLFIDLTLAFSGSVPVRIVCGICTVGILCGLAAQGGFSVGKADRRAKKASVGKGMLLGAAGSAPYLLLWMGLLLSGAGVLADGYYRYYKLLCAPFLAVCNLMQDGVLTSQLSAGAFAVLLVLSLVPGAVISIAYRMTMQGRQIEDVMYHE